MGQQSNAKLTTKGLQQSIELADFLEDKDIQCIFTSSYMRAYESIKPLADRLHMPVYTDNRLVERLLSQNNLDNWQLHLENSFNDLEVVLEGGESSRQAMERGVAAIKEYLMGDENTFAVVTHGNLLALIVNYYQPLFGFYEWKQLSNPDVFQIDFENDVVSIQRIWGY